MKNIMIDVKTMGVESDTAIVEIGAVSFDNSGVKRAVNIFVDVFDCFKNNLTYYNLTMEYWAKKFKLLSSIITNKESDDFLETELECMGRQFLLDIEKDHKKYCDTGKEFLNAFITYVYGDGLHRSLEFENFILSKYSSGSKIYSLKDSLAYFYLWVATIASGENLQVWSNGSYFDFPILQNASKEADVAMYWRANQIRCYRTLLSSLPSLKHDRKSGGYSMNVARDQALHLIRLVKANKLPYVLN